MARKSRRQKQREAAEEAQKTSRPLRTAAYCRLSSEDREMESIGTQVRLVHGFIRERPDLALEETYVDNGVTGTKFDRPEWNRLMDDVRGGRIECIAVKDLSRFGRDYLEAGYYLEKIFPKLHVRFIAITDDFDTDRPDALSGLSVPVKNMANAMYAKDVSRKVRSALEAAMERGERLGAPAPMGYRRAGSAKELAVDGEAAAVIRVIFHWSSLGVGPCQIAERLSFLGVPNPAQWQRNRIAGEPMEPAAPWQGGAAAKILANRAYCGDTVTGMTRCRMHRRENVDESEWHVTEGTHEAIVPREVLEAALGARRAARNGPRKERELSPLHGMVRCGICGRACAENHGLFFCTYHYTYRFENPCPTAVSMPVADAEKAVRAQAAAMAGTLAENGEPLRKAMDGRIAEKERELRTLRARRDKAVERGDRLYEDYAGGLIDAGEFRMLKDGYAEEAGRLAVLIREKEGETRAEKEERERLRGILGMAEDGGEPGWDLVKALVERAVLHGEDALEVRFKFDDPFAAGMKEGDGENG